MTERMSTTPDEPLMIHDSPVKRLEQAAIAAYRAKYLGGEVVSSQS